MPKKTGPVVDHPKVMDPKRGRPKGSKNLKPRPQFREVTLTVTHRINGVPFGPGVVRVSDERAQALEQAEERVKEQEYKFLNPTDAIIQIRYNSKGGLHPIIVPVRSGYFDQAAHDIYAGHAEPSFHVDDKGWRL